jgi:potassium efflux system protein
METVGNMERSFFDGLFLLWNFQLFDVEGSPITLGKVLVGLMLAVAGYFAAGIASRYVGRRLIRRLQMQSSLHYTLERLVFYLAYIFCLLFVLQLLSIPIGVFGMIGGALAIGIGFGSQNVVNNFISGLIVMVEQPLRVGDWVEIDGTFGRVEEIGSRSTYLRLLDNKEAVVPNSFFLEKMLVNWSLKDSQINGRVAVGVTYGTDTELVKGVLLKTALEHPLVLKVPAPVVLFVNFGESSLDFTLGFSIELSETTTVVGVASDLRFAINRAFSENGISMPFPHRELVWSSKQVIPVRIEAHKE